MVVPDEKVDCEFTLALNNSTGKFFFCKDMIEASADLINSTYHWRLPSHALPGRMASRILGRLALIEVSVRARWPLSYRVWRPIRHPRAMLFTDPRECVLYNVKSCDIVLCHDMGPLTHPEFYSEGVERVYRLAFDRIARARPLVLFVSEASRRDFVKLYGSDFPLLKVIHIPLRQGLHTPDEQIVDGVPEKFFLTVGSLGARKNQLRSIAAFQASGLASERFGYVVCGGPEPGAEEVISLAAKTDGVIVLGYVNDSQLRWLYKNAQGFVLASLLEGFGLPAAEAVSYGQVPLLSAGGALEEVAGDGALYVDPLDISDIAAGMRRMASMAAGERAGRLLRLCRSVERFSFDAAVSAWRSTLALAIQTHAHPAGNDARPEVIAL
jgi:glycosyltransferase involved in cell wall biosynthesis